MKATVTLGGVPLAATDGVVWRWKTGVAPYVTTLVVHNDDWDRLKQRQGQPLDLKIRDARGKEVVIQEVYILHTAPSNSEVRTSFVVADKRWKWSYKLVARDYNIPKKTGDRTAFESVPAGPTQLDTIVDQYEYQPASLDRGTTRWTAKRAIEDVLRELEDEDGYAIDSFPIEGDSERGQFTLQNITLRDAGDVALGRMLSYVPGAEVFINSEGVATVIDGADLDAAEEHATQIGLPLRGGSVIRTTDRRHVRPARVHVYYQREIELMAEYEDDYGATTSSPPVRNEPFVENVLPSVDPEMTVTEYDPERDRSETKTIYPGTFVTVSEYLAYTNSVTAAHLAYPWTWDTLKRAWMTDLETSLGGIGSAENPASDVTAEGVTYGDMATRIATLRANFRLTFRLSRRYVSRLRNLLNVRVQLLDPVTGARAPAAVWGQATVKPTGKGRFVADNVIGIRDGQYAIIDSLKASRENAELNVVQTRPSPARLDIVDKDTGVFRVNWQQSPYGTDQSILPCHTVGELSQRPMVPTIDLGRQDEIPVAAGVHTEGFTNGLHLADRMELKALFTVVPSAPNSTKQFHRVTVEADDIADVFQSEFRIKGGEGPDLHVFVPPGEATARFAWSDDQQCRQTIAKVLGLDEDDPAEAGIEHDEPLTGYVSGNAQNELRAHSRAVAAELLANFADNIEGRIMTTLPANGVTLKGNMSGVSVSVSAASSATVRVVHEFPGQQKPLNRMALMPEAVRHVINGTLPTG